MNAARLTTLEKFIRGQVALTDKHPHKPGPGSVHLNNEEATLAADALAWHALVLRPDRDELRRSAVRYLAMLADAIERDGERVLTSGDMMLLRSTAALIIADDKPANVVNFPSRCPHGYRVEDLKSGASVCEPCGNMRSGTPRMGDVHE